MFDINKILIYANPQISPLHKWTKITFSVYHILQNISLREFSVLIDYHLNRDFH